MLGSTASRVVLGGQRIAIKQRRARALDAGELQLPTFDWAASADSLNASTIAAVAAGVSTRRYRSTVDALPPGEAKVGWTGGRLLCDIEFSTSNARSGSVATVQSPAANVSSTPGF
jgi:hypothetical protein